MDKKITVRLLYRNYKPLHSIYLSLVENPPKNVEYLVPKPITKLKRFYFLYKSLRYFAITRYLIRLAEKHFFLRNNKHDDADIYQYVNMMDESPPAKPYVVEIEHALSLVSFSPDKKRIEKVKKFLEKTNCKSVICMSQAADRTLRQLLGNDYATINHKVQVVYPAHADITHSKLKADRSIIKQSNRLKILFVGTPALLKGLDELLETLRVLSTKSARQIELHVISGDAAELISEYDLKNVFLYKPAYNKQEIITKFFLPADIFISPTKQDTFGMAILDAMSAGKAVVSTGQFAIPELIDDGKDGILLSLPDAILDKTLMPSKALYATITKRNLNSSLVRQLTEELEAILNGEIDIEKMGRTAQQKFSEGGKFSASKRNQILLDIYNRALQ